MEHEMLPATFPTLSPEDLRLVLRDTDRAASDWGREAERLRQQLAAAEANVTHLQATANRLRARLPS